MWLVIGLGNPGAKYLLNRHNIGFMALDHFAAGLGSPKFKDERQALVCRCKLDDEEVLFVKPQTYMNKSGESVRALMDFYKIDFGKIIVVHDEIEQAFGVIKVLKNRGAGGHNGIKSITEMLGTQDYLRLRLGVGRPPDPRMDLAAYVLQDFSSDEKTLMNRYLEVAGDTIESIIFDGSEKAASKFNRSALE